jgi:hypothetical protein
LALLIAALLGVIGLAVGLGVGLTKGRKKDSDSAGQGDATYTQQQPDNSTPTQQLPLGQYSFVTNLRAQQTNCTSNPATWRCYPYTNLDPSNPTTNATSQSTFNWIIRNTSAIYATNDTPSSTPSAGGIPANLTLSSTNNPFALTFTNQSLTYHHSSDDDSAHADLRFHPAQNSRADFSYCVRQFRNAVLLQQHRLVGQDLPRRCVFF